MPEGNTASLSERILDVASESFHDPKRLAAMGAAALAVGAIEGAIPIVVTTVDKHRRLSHGSLELSPWLKWVTDFERSTPRAVWAAVHQPHHEFRDTTIYPQYKIEQYLQAREANPELYKDHPEIPEKFENLDPFATFTLDEVRCIGKFGIGRMQERMGEHYNQPTIFSKEEAEAILDMSQPRYYYRLGKDKITAPYTDDDRAQLLLTDPHSPALVPPRDGSDNGIRYILRGGNVTLYSHLADLFKTEPWLIPEHIQKPGTPVPKTWPMITTLYAVNIAGASAINTAVTVYREGASIESVTKGVAEGVLIGAAIGSIAIVALLKGGDITNAEGHAGAMSSRDLVKSMFQRNFNIVMKPDGTITTDTKTAGKLGKFISMFTLDEVGGQATHHDHPDAIAYTTAKRKRDRWKEAPWGSLLEKAANSKAIKSIRPGKGFPQLKVRPDVPNEAVQLIEAARVRTQKELHIA